MKTANFKVLDVTERDVFIKDCGPWDQFPTVTNSAEEVVANLIARGILKPGLRLFYQDSEGEVDELVVKNGKFTGFAPGPRVVR